MGRVSCWGRSELLFWRAAEKKATTSPTRSPQNQKGEERFHSLISQEKAGLFPNVHKKHITSQKMVEASVENGDFIMKTWNKETMIAPTTAQLAKKRYKEEERRKQARNLKLKEKSNTESRINKQQHPFFIFEGVSWLSTSSLF